MIYPKNFEQKIGFDVVRHEILRRCVSPMGISCAERMQFSARFDDVRRLLTQTNEFLAILQSKREFPLNFFFDLRTPLRTITAPGTYLSAENLFNLQRSLSTVGQIIDFFKPEDDEPSPYPQLSRLTASLNSFPAITAHIAHIIDKFGNVKDNASPQLLELRQTIASTTASINGLMRRIIAQGRQSGVFDSDTAPSVRDGRLVLPVAPMHKRKVKGIVHDESASGKTIFIEPEEIVEANNRIRETEAEIAREIIRILTEVTDLIRPHVDELLSTYETLGKIDFIRAKASFALDIDAQMPNLHTKPTIEWYHAIHPALFLSLKQHGKEVVPLNLQLDGDNRILVISGPNAGGKSVCLKTVGVIQYMMQCGVLPPLHSNSHMGFFKSIFIDIGDQQSIEDDLSTYSSHLQNMKTFLNSGDQQSLMLIDEFGSGTEPQIGAAIAQAILEQLNAKQVMGVITTHYHNLKHMAEDTPGLINGAMLYDRQHMQPLFQLSIGYPGSSFAIEIARKTGLPAQVIDKASEIVGSDYINMDKYLLDIVRDRKYWENKRYDIHQKEKRLDAIIADFNARIDALKQEHKSIIKEARNEAEDIIRQSNAQVERTIKEIRQMQAEKEKTKEVRQQLDDFKDRLQQLDDDGQSGQRIKEMTSKLPAKPKTKNKVKKTADEKRPLAAGDNVLLKGASSVGTILSIDEKYALVAFGNLKTRVETERLEHTLKKPSVATSKPASLSASTTDEIRSRQLQFKPDIDVRGMRADEAIQAITYFIDDAIQFNASRVRILHGTGTGVLREVIRQYLNTVPGVTSYRDEHVQFGGAGITIVDLD